MLGAYLLEQDALPVSQRPILRLQLLKHCRLRIRQPNGDSLLLIASIRSSFSVIASLQNAEIFKQRLLFNNSSAWWSCWVSPSG